MALANIRNRITNYREGSTMNSENIAATPAHERIDAVEVQERLSWPSAPAAAYCDTWLMVNAGALNFKASEEHQVSAMANIGHQLLQEIAAYRPAFKWTISPAEIVGALIEEVSTKPPTLPRVEIVPEMWQSRIAAVKERFPAMTHQEAQSNAILSEVVDLRRALADALAAIPSGPTQSSSCPTDSDMIDFLERTGSVVWDFEACSIRFDVPNDLIFGSVREIVTAAIVAEEARV
ncbi:hypothetical protein O0882_23295 [Janthinobacterium sp. SUN073]|uniref:hypothetical protein n=1 Tax=Janthinobacterium sp. SUN073 TaxID=3004102 RepID=UPI0025B1B435|nr:hypothetical protein [Janthinobacterium sp. SUN073]MDN2699247.1 hypothetical protein [Janthinobacterium sp. SUN073]